MAEGAALSRVVNGFARCEGSNPFPFLRLPTCTKKPGAMAELFSMGKFTTGGRTAIMRMGRDGSELFRIRNVDTKKPGQFPSRACESIDLEGTL